MLTDTLPALGLAIAYGLDHWTKQWQPNPKQWLALGLCLGLLLYSVLVQTVGAFGSVAWDQIPTPNDKRLWDWQDSQIVRHTQRVFYSMVDPIADPEPYRQHWNGTIHRIFNPQGELITDRIIVRAARRQELTAEVQNTGRSPWFGYKTGMADGTTVVRVRFFNQNNQPTRVEQQNLLYVSGSPKPSETTTAIGSIVFPGKPGIYKMVFELDVLGISASEANAPSPQPYVVQAQVEPRRS